MLRIKVIVDFEEGDGYSLAREMEVGLTDEAIAEIAKAIAAQQSVQSDMPSAEPVQCPHCLQVFIPHHYPS